MKREDLTDPLEDGESFYVVIPCTAPFRREDFHGDVVTCRAMSEADAAAIAHDKIHAERTDVDPDYTTEMFVIAFEPEDVKTYLRGVQYEEAADEFQCCGGNDYTGTGHAASCPKVPLERDV